MDPTPIDLEAAANRFGLHPVAVEDANKGHQRAKLERYGDTVLVVIRPAWYDNATERVDIGEVHLFVGPQFVITVRHGDRPDLSAARALLEADPKFLSIGPEAMLTAFLDVIVDSYAPVVAGLVNDTDGEVENRLRNVLDHAMRRMSIASLAQGEESRRLAEETIDQGEQVKKILSWAAILFTPTLVASIYGLTLITCQSCTGPEGTRLPSHSCSVSVSGCGASSNTDTDSKLAALSSETTTAPATGSHP